VIQQQTPGSPITTSPRYTPETGRLRINAANASITDTGIDPLTALEQWVEHDTPPDSLLATKRTKDGATVWQRPVCAYPQIAQPAGGDPTQPAGWACAAP
jgi:feruloyl esterase